MQNKKSASIIFISNSDLGESQPYQVHQKYPQLCSKFSPGMCPGSHSPAGSLRKRQWFCSQDHVLPLASGALSWNPSPLSRQRDRCLFGGINDTAQISQASCGPHLTFHLGFRGSARPRTCNLTDTCTISIHITTFVSELKRLMEEYSDIKCQPRTGSGVYRVFHLITERCWPLSGESTKENSSARRHILESVCTISRT